MRCFSASLNLGGMGVARRREGMVLTVASTIPVHYVRCAKRHYEIVRFMIESADWLCQNHFVRSLIGTQQWRHDPAPQSRLIASLSNRFEEKNVSISANEKSLRLRNAVRTSRRRARRKRDRPRADGQLVLVARKSVAAPIAAESKTNFSPAAYSSTQDASCTAPCSQWLGRIRCPSR
jgi:hypothetical protein